MGRSPGKLAERCYAVGGDGFVSVVMPQLWPARLLADKPQASWVPSDLTDALAAAPIVAGCRQATRLFDLLLACLRLRFDDAISVGPAKEHTGMDDDIALAPGGEPGDGARR